MSKNIRMDEENQQDLVPLLIDYINEHQLSSVSFGYQLIDTIVAKCYIHPDFDLIMFINTNIKIIFKYYRTIDEFIDALRTAVKQNYRNIIGTKGISVPLDKLRDELVRIDRVLSYYRTTNINSILSDYSQRFGGKKLQFDGSDIQSQSDSVIIMSQDNKQLKKDLQELRARYAALENENNRNNALLNGLREQLSQTVNQEQLREQIAKCENNQNDIKSKSKTILSQIEKLESIMQNNEETRRQHEEKYIKMEEENTGLRDTNADLQKRIDELESNKKNLNSELKRLKTEVLENQKSNEEAQIEFEKIKETNERLENQINVLKSEINGQQRQFASERREIELQADARFDKLYEQSRSDSQMYRSDLQTLQTKYQDATTQIQELYGQLADARKGQGYFEGKCDGAQAQISDLQAYNRVSEQRVEDIQQYMFEQQKDYNQLQYNVGYLQGRNEGLKELQKFTINTSNKLLDSKDKEIDYLKENAENLWLQLENAKQFIAQLQCANQKLLIDGNAIIQSQDKVIQEKERLEVVERENRKRVYEEGEKEGIKKGMERMRREYSKLWDDMNTEKQQLTKDNEQLRIKYDTVKKEKEEQEKQLTIVQKQLDVKAPVKDVDNEDDRIKSYILWSIPSQYLIEDFLDKKTGLQKYTPEEFEEIKKGCDIRERTNNEGHAIIILTCKNKKALFYKYYNKETSKYIYVSMNPLIMGRTADSLIQHVTGETRPMIRDIQRERRRNETDVLDIDVADDFTA